MGDFIEELKARLDDIEEQANSLYQEKARIDEELREVTAKWNALRVIYENETKNLGKISDSFKRFAGMGVIAALKIIKAEQPNITRQQAHDILVKEGFDFRGKKSRRVVNFGWMALERSKK
jgi:predicted nuclease with TOPRIM domain